ncbi:hypothetical protein BN137_3261 [Cronobacter condimenti 1330]|uniref:Uncharacterized protein n=1 Tax=Cronobacter condimenti 1330 TaxID=1073999 RepID=K8AHZ2_9ENTR|nr:hypothetical protein BN137_3261 [Cronobacter condimenti 1330]
MGAITAKVKVWRVGNLFFLPSETEIWQKYKERCRQLH